MLGFLVTREHSRQGAVLVLPPYSVSSDFQEQSRMEVIFDTRVQVYDTTDWSSNKVVGEHSYSSDLTAQEVVRNVLVNQGFDPNDTNAALWNPTTQLWISQHKLTPDPISCYSQAGVLKVAIIEK